jgi:Tfp pilus assembly protein PilN
VNRFDYLSGARQAAFDSRPSGLTIDNRLRIPLAAFVAAITLVTMLGIVQFARLHAAQNRYERASVRLAAAGPALDEIGALRARVARESRTVDAVAGLQRTSLDRANELTWIGNRLPAHTWLRALRFENGDYTLEGTSDRAAAVGAAMLALRGAAPAARPQLVSLSDDGTRAAPRVRYTLRVETKP